MKRCRKVCLAVLLVLFICISAGCAGQSDVEETTISVSSKGAVKEIIIDTAEGKSYTETELKSYVEGDIGSFNQKAGNDNIKVSSCEIKDQSIKIVVDYASWSDYAAYHNTRFFLGTIKEAQQAGYDFQTEFKDNNGEKAAVATILANDSDWRVLIMEEPVHVILSGKILYASSNADISAKKEAVIEASKDDGSQNITTDAPVYLIYK